MFYTKMPIALIEYFRFV